MISSKITKFSVVAIAATFLLSGCSQKAQHQTSFTPDGKLKSEHIVKEDAIKIETYDYQAVFHDKTLLATGVFSHKNETIALNMATNMAINNLAKSAGKVIQKEDSTLYNDKVHMIITTKANNIVKGFQILSQEFDITNGRAEVTIKQDGSILASELSKYVKEYK